MANFESSEHFYYYVRKILTNGGVKKESITDNFKEVCIRIYDMEKGFLENSNKKLRLKKITKTYSWELRNKINNGDDYDELESFTYFFIEELGRFIITMNKGTKYKNEMLGEKLFYWTDVDKLKGLVRDLSNDFTEEFEKHRFSVGVYFLYNDEEELIYVGKSKNLFDRMFDSIRERKATKYSYVITPTKAEMHIYEIYYILKLKPKLNADCSEEDELSFDLPSLEMNPIKSIYSPIISRMAMS